MQAWRAGPVAWLLVLLVLGLAPAVHAAVPQPEWTLRYAAEEAEEPLVLAVMELEAAPVPAPARAPLLAPGGPQAGCPAAPACPGPARFATRDRSPPRA
jgi:hypothetical protein